MGGMKARQEGDRQRGLPASGLGGSRAVVVPRPEVRQKMEAHASSPGVEAAPNVGQGVCAWAPADTGPGYLWVSVPLGVPPAQRKEGTDL